MNIVVKLNAFVRKRKDNYIFENHFARFKQND